MGRSRGRSKSGISDREKEAPKVTLELAAQWPGDGTCPLCRRNMVPGPSLNEHHLVPKSLGGRKKYFIHRTCHQKIHSVFSEKELEKEYYTFEKLLSHPEIEKFVQWVKKQPAESITQSRWLRSRRQR